MSWLELISATVALIMSSLALFSSRLAWIVSSLALHFPCLERIVSSVGQLSRCLELILSDLERLSLWLSRLVLLVISSRCSSPNLVANVPQIYAVADCGLLSCRTAPRLKRRSWLHNPSEKRQLTYILLLATGFYLFHQKYLFSWLVVAFVILSFCPHVR